MFISCIHLPTVLYLDFACQWGHAPLAINLIKYKKKIQNSRPADRQVSVDGRGPGESAPPATGWVENVLKSYPGRRPVPSTYRVFSHDVTATMLGDKES